MSNLHPL